MRCVTVIEAARLCLCRPRHSHLPVQAFACVILGYMTRMGVSSAFVEAMSATKDIRGLTPQQAVAMKLVTDLLAQR